MKTCTKCGETKPEKEGFYKTKYGYHGSCKECFKKKADESRKRLGKDHILNRDLVWRYGITLEEYKSYPQECNICGSKEEGRGYKMNVDHDHQTGKVRGLLCNSCNRGLGMLGESNLLAAIHYINQSKEQ